MSEATFLHEAHVRYIERVSQDTNAFEYLITEHLRMSGVYWGVTAMAVLGAPTHELRASQALRIGGVPLADWVVSCQHEGGG